MYKIWWCAPSLFLIFILIHRGESIYCFTCQAPNNSSNACVQNVSLQTMAAVNCSKMGNYLFCKSSIINGTVVRSCANYYDCLDSKGQQMNCNLCTGDYCNSGYVNNSMTGTRGVQPGDRRLQPITTTLRPGDRRLQPITTTLRPGDRRLQPITTTLRPTDAKPAAGAMIEAQFLYLLLFVFVCIRFV